MVETPPLSANAASAAPLGGLPTSMNHSGVPAEIGQKIGVLESTIRLAIGIEHPSDLIADIAQDLNKELLA